MEGENGDLNLLSELVQLQLICPTTSKCRSEHMTCCGQQKEAAREPSKFGQIEAWNTEGTLHGSFMPQSSFVKVHLAQAAGVKLLSFRLALQVRPTSKSCSSSAYHHYTSTVQERPIR